MARKAPRLLALLVSSVWFLAGRAGAQPIGGIDFPGEGQTVTGIVKVSGFVLDFNNIDRVEVLVDGILVNRADIEPAPPRRPRDLPRTTSTAPLRIPGFSPRSWRAASSATVRTRSRSASPSRPASSSSRSPPVNVIVDSSLNQAPFGYIDIPARVRPGRRQRLVPGVGLGRRRRRHRPHRLPGRRPDRGRRRRPRRARHGGLRHHAPGRRGGVSGPAAGALLRILREHQHDTVHQRPARPVGPRDRQRRGVPGPREPHRPDRSTTAPISRRSGASTTRWTRPRCSARRSAGAFRLPARPTSAATS